MKKVLKFFLWINAAALFILNLSVNLNLVDANSIKLTLKQEQALADECGGGCAGWGISCSHVPGGDNGYCYTCTTTGGEKRFMCGDSHWWYGDNCKK